MWLTFLSNFLLLSCLVTHRDLHSFPTRRSSDLVLGEVLRRPKGSAQVGEEDDQVAQGHRAAQHQARAAPEQDRKSTRLNSSHTVISYAVFCLKKKNDNLYVSPRGLG